MVDDAVLDQNMDRMTSMPKSPISLPGFGPNAFSIDQLLEIIFPGIGSAKVCSSSSVRIVPPGSVSSSRKSRQVLSPDQFEQFLHKISHVGPLFFSPSYFGHVDPRPAGM